MSSSSDRDNEERDPTPEQIPISVPEESTPESYGSPPQMQPLSPGHFLPVQMPAGSRRKSDLRPSLLLRRPVVPDPSASSANSNVPLLSVIDTGQRASLGEARIDRYTTPFYLLRWIGTAFTMPYSALVAMQMGGHSSHLRHSTESVNTSEHTGGHSSHLRNSTLLSEPRPSEPLGPGEKSRPSLDDINGLVEESMFKKGSYPLSVGDEYDCFISYRGGTGRSDKKLKPI